MIFSTSLLLKNKAALYEDSYHPKNWSRILTELALVSFVGLAIFGAIIGTVVPSWTHSAILSWNMIILLWGSMALCTPALFVFSAIRGSSIKFFQLLYLLVGAVATISVVILSLTPISWFFIWATPELPFIRALNGMIVVLGVIFGIFFISSGYQFIHKKVKATQVDHKSASDILFLWFVLLCVVLVQMSMKLGPWYQ